MIGEKLSEFFGIFRNIFVRFVPSKISKHMLRRDDSFGPKIVEIGAILAIVQPFDSFQSKTHFTGL